MVAVTADQARTILRADNPRAPLGDVEQYVAAWLEWRYAAANIAEHGSVVLHPRTAGAIENPYIKVRASASASMARLKSLRHTDRLWAA